MAKGISIGIAADARAFQSAVRNDVLQPLEDTVDALRDVDKAAGSMELEDTMRDAQRDTERLTDETDELRDALREAARKAKDLGDAGSRAGRDASDGFDRAKQGVDEFRDEANSTAREAAASFDGSAESIGEAFQETAANAFAGFGPAGAAAGIAAALGLGAITTVINDQKAAADELKQKLTDAYLAAAEEGRNYLSVQQIIEESKAIYEDPERAAEALRIAKDLTVDRSLIVQAMAGDEDAINAVITAATDKESERRDILVDSLGVQGNRVALADEEINKLQQIRDRFSEQLGLQDEAKANAEEYLGVVEEQGTKERDNISRAQAADAARWAAYQQNIANARSKASQPVTMPVNVAVSTAEAQRRIDTLVNRKYEIEVGVRYRNGKEALI